MFVMPDFKRRRSPSIIPRSRRSELVKILNNGNARGFPVLRVEQNEGQHAWSVLYEVSDEGLRRLKRIEGFSL